MRWRIVFLVIMLGLCGCKKELIQNIDEARAHRVITELYALGIDADKVKQADGVWTIEVHARDLTKAIAVLSNRKLMPEAVSEETKPSLMDSKEEHQYAYQRKLSISLEKTLETFPHILRARVHIHLPPAIDTITAFSQNESEEGKESISTQGSASILLLTDDNAEVTQEQIAAIISGASGISRDTIAVIFERVPTIASQVPVPQKDDGGGASAEISPDKVVPPSASTLQASQSAHTILWGTTMYLIGIISILGAATMMFLRKNRAVRVGHKLLYEGK